MLESPRPCRLPKNNTRPSASRGCLRQCQHGRRRQGMLIGRAQVQTAPPWSLRWLQAGRLRGCQWTSCAHLPHASSRPQPCGSCLWSAHHLQTCGRAVKPPDSQVSAQLISAED